MKFVDLFAGIGGFHLALSRLGHKCVFASEIDEELRHLYLRNFPNMKGKVFGDIRESKSNIPDHDILCAGFPCQPFSKSGGQLGTRDETRGTLFHEILDVLERKRPRFVFLENVGNFGRHDGGRTWKIVRERLMGLGYNVAGTEHRTPASGKDWRDVGSPTAKPHRDSRNVYERQVGGHGLISPHHFGHPHHRERFFIFATLGDLPSPPFPALNRQNHTSLNDIVQSADELSPEDKRETRLTDQQRACIEHWNDFVRALPKDLEPPSFPLWGDEFDAQYPFEDSTPWATPPLLLGKCFNPQYPKYTRKDILLAQLPSYAREEVPTFRQWKIRYIRQNRLWWSTASPYFPSDWAHGLKSFPPSLRKLEWNAKGGERDLWQYVLQFRPSGLRVKRYTSSPALVAMTATQIPILGPERRFITRTEGRRLQGFPDEHQLPYSRERTFKALGNAVHVGVIERLAAHLIEAKTTSIKPVHLENPRVAFA